MTSYLKHSFYLTFSKLFSLFVFLSLIILSSAGYSKAPLASSSETLAKCKRLWTHSFLKLNEKTYQLSNREKELTKSSFLSVSTNRCPIMVSEEFEIQSHHPRVEITTSKTNRAYYVNLYVDPGPNQWKYTYDLSLLYQGQEIARITQHIRRVSKWSSSFLTGANYNLYFPNGTKADQKRLQGVDINCILHAWNYKNQRRGPSLGRIYLQTSLLKSVNRDELTIKYGLGIDLSFERNPYRNFLIPIFGLEAGGIYGPYKNTELHSRQVTPRMGLVLFHNEMVFLSVAGGYVIPFPNLEEMRGWDVKAGLHFTMW